MGIEKFLRPIHAAILVTLLMFVSWQTKVALAQDAVAIPAAATESSPGGDAAAASSLAAEAQTKEAGLIPSRNLLSIVKDGGPLMIPIVICSIILFLFVFERTISLRRGKVIPRPFVKRFLHQLREGQLDQDAAIELCQKNGSAVAQVFGAAVNKWGRPAVEVEQAIIDTGERVTNGLRRYLRLLNGVATVSPLLGLLGTVVGMIKAFNDIASADAMGNPEILAGGISVALLTTAAGLSVAIPALIFYLFFTGRVDRLVMDIDQLGQDVVAEISAEAAQKPKTLRRKKAAA